MKVKKIEGMKLYIVAALWLIKFTRNHLTFCICLIVKNTFFCYFLFRKIKLAPIQFLLGLKITYDIHINRYVHDMYEWHSHLPFFKDCNSKLVSFMSNKIKSFDTKRKRYNKTNTTVKEKYVDPYVHVNMHGQWA